MEFLVDLPWELLYADDLMVIADNKEKRIRKLRILTDGLEMKGMKMNLFKTKLVGTKDIIQRKLKGNGHVQFW